jgi:monoterpene epsilon-lactone hydrolase
MTSIRARCVRFFLRYTIGRMYRRAGQSVSDLRKLDDVLVRSEALPKGTRVSRGSLNGRYAEWIQARDARTDAAILQLHGGAFVTGSPATHRELAARISAATGVRVFSPEYRLAPEHPFPAALQDVLGVYRWLVDEMGPASRVIIGGESSGGGLALQALLAMKEEGQPLPAAAFFMSPVTDWVDFDGDSYTTRVAVDPLLSPEQCRFTASLYVGENAGNTPLLKPVGMNLAGLPPMWIQAGDREILLSDAERLARRAAEAGVEVDFKVWPGMWHVFQAAARLVPEGRDSLTDLGRFVGKHLGIEPEGKA